MHTNQEINNSQKSETSTFGYNCVYDQKLSVLDSLKLRNTLSIMKDHQDTFQIIQRAPYHISTIIKQDQNNKKEFQDGFAGSGGYGQVLYAEHMDGSPCVVKVQKIDDFEEFLQQLNEYKIQQTLNKVFPLHFVKLIDRVVILQENINTFSSYAGLEIAITTLDVYSQQVNIEKEEYQSIYHQILRSIINMHSLKIAHRDIKPSNIMYTYNKGWIIGDFGCALKYKKSVGVFQIEGTTQYLPKKYRMMLQNQSFSESKMDLFENDIYAFLLTMLKIQMKDCTIYQLQHMLDDQNMYNQLPQELQILTQNQFQLSQQLKRGVLKVPLQQVFYAERFYQIKTTLQQFKKKKENILPVLYNILYFRNEIQAKDREIKNEAQNYDDLKIYIELMDPYFTVKESTQIPPVTSETTFEQYQIISEYWFRLGNISQKLKLCQQYQKYTAKHQFQVKLEELSIYMFQEDYQKADQLIIQLSDDEPNMDDITFVQLQIIKTIRGRIWLEVADQFQRMIYDANRYVDYIENWMFLLLGNFSWIYQTSIVKHYRASKDYKVMETLQQENQILSTNSVHLPRWIELCNWKGLDHQNSVQDMIKQLKQRGADSYGVKIFIQQLIKRIDMNNEKQIIINLFETAILIYENDFPNSSFFWEIYFHFSQYCFSIKDFQKSLDLALIALKLIDIDNQYYYIQIELMIICILTKQNKFDESKNRISKIWQFIAGIKSQASRSTLLSKLHSILTIFFDNNQIENLECISNELFNYVEQEQVNSIIMQCQTIISDIAFIIKNRKKLNNSYQSWVAFCKNTQEFDPQIFQLFYKYIYVQQVLMKSEEEIKQYLQDLSKYIQNSIVYDEIIGLEGWEVLRIQHSQWQYLQGAQQLDQESLFKQMAIQQKHYFELNYYHHMDEIQNLNNIKINYTQ
ncbi:unnamed protein product (macronuclear) [Paramecium tetraurelia]|uniref:Protein kinase domain-containing protein n=1 Tax=Paramecium tetraurelia TaxID=5888 RepID=A0C303_PARTE|nr:uncharacterized protein GSPATT00034648001 [Paramecium tetraurelia]CAK65170.1 unnamed protein product [Paramecium tetraurelia]|eukprot:XP_001432567.1 hypothetical protein (macronuclear) [Paramecium tetraurelia strain d4-2]